MAENGGKLIGRGTKLEEEKKSGREKKKKKYGKHEREWKRSRSKRFTG